MEKLASDITSVLMGTDVIPRRSFIYEHANEAEIDAIKRGKIGMAEQIITTEYAEVMQKALLIMR